jgi:hypothetical protein
LRGLPLSERKRDLRRLCLKSRVPFFSEVQTVPNGELLYEHCDKFGFEGVISKRLSSRYIIGPSRNWTNAKCANWKRINADRGKPFENYRKPEPNARERELTKKREALERMQERLHSSDLRPGIARELRKQVIILEQESC